MTQDAAQLGLEARASQDVYGSGPQSFPYVAFFQEPWYGGGGGGEEPAVRRTHTVRNFGFEPSKAHESVYIHGGKIYCGTQLVNATFDADKDGWDTYAAFGNGQVYLNVALGTDGTFSASVSGSTSGDLSILLYRITDGDLEDFVSGTMFIPYYN